MPRQKSNHKKQKTPAKAKSAGRPIWKGTINFGLVNIPVALYSAEADSSIDFDFSTSEIFLEFDIDGSMRRPAGRCLGMKSSRVTNTKRENTWR